jgi:hypothetical protein
MTAAPVQVFRAGCLTSRMHHLHGSGRSRARSTAKLHEGLHTPVLHLSLWGNALTNCLVWA